jgi:hypothetical protein
VLEKYLGKSVKWYRVLRRTIDARSSLLYVAIALLIVLMVHRPVELTSGPGRAVPVAEVSGKNWRYDLSFPVHNLSVVEQLIQCESQGQNISRVDTNGQLSRGILQFNGTSTWNEMEHRFDFYGDPRNPSQAIHMADMMISNGFVGRWTCARSLGLTK